MNGRAIAIITARGGSKRIPKKNIKEFCGKPIIAYSIEAAINSGIFDEVMVSTDSEEIAEIARQYGAKVPFMRSEKTASDFATTADVLVEVIDEYKKRGVEFEYMACLYPTAPFITPEKLKNGFDMLVKNDGLMAMTVVPFSYPPQRAFVMNEEYIQVKWIENLEKRSQDLEKMYHDCGQFYFYKVEGFAEKKGRITQKIVPVIVDELHVQDIDNEVDWKMAELKFALMRQG
ncbi:MAG: pseudaminic acid cytidylyltransferase [Lachnospiraceae bacterium]